MDARLKSIVLLVAAALSLGASHRTRNFIIQAPTARLAREIGEAAEQYRRELATEWLGEPMPDWSRPCTLTARVSPQLGAGGATSFVFDRGEVFGWRMNIQGSRERILDSVLPHEVMHTVFASRFRQPLPRWADEGACTTVEAPGERRKQQRMLVTFLKTGRGIPFDRMFAMKDYPRDVLPLYSQGHSLASYLLAQGGRAKFLDFLEEGMEGENWPAVVNKHYGYRDLYHLQNAWLEWVKGGSPPLERPATTAVAAAESGKSVRPVGTPATFAGGQQPEPPSSVRGQSPEPAPPRDAVAREEGLVPVGPPTRVETGPSEAALAAAPSAGGWKPAGTTSLREAAGGKPISYAQQVAAHLSGGRSQQTSRPQPIQKLEQRVIEGQRSGNASQHPPEMLMDAALRGQTLRR